MLNLGMMFQVVEGLVFCIQGVVFVFFVVWGVRA